MKEVEKDACTKCKMKFEWKISFCLYVCDSEELENFENEEDEVKIYPVYFVDEVA